MRFDIITLFPDMFGSLFSGGVVKKALDNGLIEIQVHDLRDFSVSKHKQVDDRPFGGGHGMVIKPEPIFSAVEKIRDGKEIPVYLLSPQGKQLNHRLAEELAREARLILICGRYEGVDERVIEYLTTGEISVGDYVLTGGEPAAWVIIEAVSRFVPGVVGKAESVRQESFIDGLYDFPQYTRPRNFRGMAVPDVLFSGDHGKIQDWRRRKALEKTCRLRPDMIKQKELSPKDRKILEEIHKGRKSK
ncbi:MAG: tRNA (guanosine(37)-N1)-methyltransferase TrmD [Candidatus Aminicenantes bacterium]|nr:MAG: tRNA (guanosine(37)-N1)-methyltransferase TrmD [Candidatus Aminicenantes bacterium]